MTDSRLLEQWPTYDDKSLKGDLGVAMVKLAVARNLGWAFRDKSQIDLGLDGEIEVREPDGTTRGRVLSVQIKCGSSFLRSESDLGFRYRPKPQHLNYWLSYTTPVLLILVDDETETCYWQHVHAKNLRIVNGVNVLDVPRNQALDEPSRWILKGIAGGLQQIDFVRQLFRIWLAESSLFTHTWNNELQIPRDFHGFNLWLPDLPGRGTTAADVVLGGPGFGTAERNELDELLSLGAYNKRNASCDHILVGLVSANQQALDRLRLPRPPAERSVGITVEFVPLLFRDEGGLPDLVELDAQGQSMDDEIDFLYLDRNKTQDRDLNEKQRRANRLWGSL